MRLKANVAITAALIPLVGLMGLNAVAQRIVPPVPKAKKRVPAAKTTAPLVSFREEVEPLLRAHCSDCHGKEKSSGAFSLETPERLLKGGESFGAKVVVPGKAAQSILIAYLRGTEEPQMPLGRTPLSQAQIRLIETWINQGAKIDPVKLRFPYTAPVSVTPPRVKNTAWVHNPVDNFVLAKLEAKGLKPALPAPKITLLRRVYADLVGMPPTPQEANRFLSDPKPDAYEKLVDRLLADPRYGERWGRHWLDLVRFSETHGFENDGVRPRAWRYRDYVIRSLNADKPYSRFVAEQIAGDELFPGDADALIATGYARLGTWDELSTDPKQRWQDYLNDATDTTGSVFLGLTVGCARCHDHKYDRISQADYYRLQAFFVQTKWTDAPLPAPASDNVPKDIIAARAQIETLKKQRDDRREKYTALLREERTKAAKPGEKPDTKISDRDIEQFLERDGQKAEREAFAGLGQEQRTLENKVTPYAPVAEVINDGDPAKAPAQHILLRGELSTPGAIVEPGFVASLVGGVEKPAQFSSPAGGKTTGRRTALAKWLGSETNPLTARVMVNRMWQHHFGSGIVGTPSDFGFNGEKASHPELLDYLALRFMRDGWSLKKMHRLMVLSSTYRQSTTPGDARWAKVDPGNHLLSHANRVRLEGEALRDSILSVSGQINLQTGGPSVYPKVSDEVLSTGSTHKWGSSPADQQTRRTVYTFQRRSLMLPIVEAFDGADMSGSCPRRSATTIAPQALALFNSAFSHEESEKFAVRVTKEAGPSVDRQIERAYRIALSRAPTKTQATLARDFLSRKAQMYQPKRTPADARQAALADFCHVLINVNEFIYLD